MKQFGSKSLVLMLTVALAMGMLFSSCRGDLFAIKGEGSIESVELDINEFTGVELESAFDVEIVKGDQQSVIAVGHSNIIDRIEKDVVNGVWKMDLEKGRYKDYELTIKITAPEINKIYISGSGDITSEGFDNISTLKTGISGSGNIKGTSKFTASSKVDSYISGSGNITLDIDAPSTETDISGSGNVTISGTAADQNISIPGSGIYYGFNLDSETTDVSISGSGDVEVTVEKTLDVNISGSGNVYYKGTPQINTNISGSGDIHNAN